MGAFLALVALPRINNLRAVKRTDKFDSRPLHQTFLSKLPTRVLSVHTFQCRRRVPCELSLYCEFVLRGIRKKTSLSPEGWYALFKQFVHGGIDRNTRTAN